MAWPRIRVVSHPHKRSGVVAPPPDALRLDHPLGWSSLVAFYGGFGHSRFASRVATATLLVIRSGSGHPRCLSEWLRVVEVAKATTGSLCGWFISSFFFFFLIWVWKKKWGFSWFWFNFNFCMCVVIKLRNKNNYFIPHSSIPNSSYSFSNRLEISWTK